MLKRKSIWLVVLGTLALLCPRAAEAQVSTSELKPSIPGKLEPSGRRVVFDSGPFSAGSVVPIWDKGFLVSFVPESASPTSPNVALYDANGHKAREATIWFPDAETVFILNAAVTSDGNIVASGTAVKHDGTRAYFIATAAPSGKVATAIQTNPFFPRYICGSADGTVWSFGELDRKADGTRVDGDMLREFDTSKGVISSYLPGSTLGDSVGSPLKGRAGKEVYFRCAGNNVDIYAGSKNQYLRFDTRSRSIERFTMEPTAAVPVRGLALTTSGRVYGHLRDYSQATSQQGLFSLEFDQKAGMVRWKPIPGASGIQDQTGVVSGLWGADGESLVFTTFDDPAGRRGVSWSKAVASTTNLNQK